MSSDELKRLTLRIFLVQQLAMLTALGPVAYMVVLLMGVSGEVAWKITLINLATDIPLFGVIVPILVIRGVTKHALEINPSDAPGDRLRRILMAPRRIEFGLLLSYIASSALYTGWPVLVYGLSPWVIPMVQASFLLLVLLIFIRQSVGIQRLLQPYALEEFHKHPQITLKDNGLLWPKLSWYLPYCFALFVLCTLVVTASIVGKKSQSAFLALNEELGRIGSPAVQALVTQHVKALSDSMLLPIGLVGGFLIIAAAWSAWELARHVRSGTDSVRTSIESLVSGRPELPKWVNTDEVGDLAQATSAAFEQLRGYSMSLGESAQMLRKSAETLGASHREQTQVLSVQAAALQETQVTAQEIKQTSLLAAQKAETVLQQAMGADQISRAGEAAIEQSLGGLKDIQQQVVDMAARIKALDERAQQIANITSTVKDLADQSNMLALNAAIEAVRSGEHGKGFGVVAREIRSLADQSIKATNHVREILQDISEAISTTVSITEKGSEKVESSVAQVRAFGDNIRQLSGIVRDNASSVRQISAAVQQQNMGIGQIFQAVNDLTKMMDQTMTSLQTTDSAASTLLEVATKVSGFVDRYDWDKQGVQGGKPPPSAS